MVDLFRTVISAGRLEEMLIEVGTRFSTTRYHRHRQGRRIANMRSLLSPFGFEWRKDARTISDHLDTSTGRTADTAD